MTNEEIKVYLEYTKVLLAINKILYEQNKDINPPSLLTMRNMVGVLLL